VCFGSHVFLMFGFSHFYLFLEPNNEARNRQRSLTNKGALFLLHGKYVKHNLIQLKFNKHKKIFLGLGPILPQMVMFGRQLGVSPTVMGFFLSILPFLYFFAKPLVGMLADYFSVSS